MSVHRVAREQRLRLKSDFENIRYRGVSRANAFLAIRAVPNGRERPRFGFIVSKKVSSSSVRRNRIRRVLKDIIKRLPLRKNRDILIIARNPSLNASHAELLLAARTLCSKLELLQPDSRESAGSNLN